MNTMTTNDRTRRVEYAEIAVEQLTDEISDPGAVALSRFTNGEDPDLGPAEGEQHALTTFYIGEYQPEAEQR